MEPTNPNPTPESVTPPVTPPTPVTPPAGGGAFAEVPGETPPAPVVPLAERIPEKYRVAKEDGSIDVEASTAKLLDGHAELQKKFGAGDLPPKTPEDYAPTVEGLDFEELKADPQYAGFLKGAHAKGLTNDQVSWVLNEYASRAGDDGAVAALGMTTAEFQQAMEPVWQDVGGYQAGMGLAMRTLRTYGGDLTKEELATIPNNPIVAKVLAAIGKELPEDGGTPRAGTMNVADWETEVTTLRGSEAYNDAKHPEHKQAIAKMAQLYAKRYPNK